ncbi:unnamed protein product [Cuscuta campestris]|uniref:Uncharacterized protein n=1 Tax=Cuscuta campestris TaxID=132261 RepID=A0A484KDP6_9ASTE|nr:unnamed protein product [Cuscuta campestris]
MPTPKELIELNRGSSEVHTDPEVCKQKTLELLREINMPSGLLPLKDIVEVGRNRENGFVWLQQRKETYHEFQKIGKKVWYDSVVTATVDDRRMKDVSGVKSKELLLWVALSLITVSKKDAEKIVFATPAGLARSYAVSAFEGEEEEKKEEEEIKN